MFMTGVLCTVCGAQVYLYKEIVVLLLRIRFLYRYTYLDIKKYNY